MRSVLLILCVFAVFSLVGGVPGIPGSPKENTRYDDDDEMPTSMYDRQGRRIVFDFIVVGAGASGCIVAARLANETNQNILLLEGGSKQTGQRDVGGTDFVAAQFKTNPITGKQKLGDPLTRYDVVSMSASTRQASDVLDNMWNITANAFFYAQAKAVGGNQATNGAYWMPPRKNDLDRWGIPEYNSANFWPYFQRIEDATPTGFPGRGTTGKTQIEFGNFTTRDQSSFVTASIGAGYTNGGDIANGELTDKSYYYIQFNTRSGIRDSTSVAYLAKVLGHRPNLDFRTSAVVTRVLFAFNVAIGVEYSDEHGHLHKVYASKEVILTTGALQTAKVLFNSGIGPASILTAFNKPHRVVNEIIGQKTRNHQKSSLTFVDPNFQLPNLFTYPANSVQYARDGTGALNQEVVQMSFQVNPTAPYPEIGLYVFTGGVYPIDPYGNNIVISVYLNQQIYANGTSNLTSSDPLAGTTYAPNLMVNQADVDLIAQGFFEVRRIMQYWPGGAAVETSPGTNYTTVADLRPFIIATGANSCHYYSTTPMGTDPSAPVDIKMKVRGVHHLRVVGVAAAPGEVFVGMQALAMALAEKGTDIIKADHGL